MSEGQNILKQQSQKSYLGELVVMYRIFAGDVNSALGTIYITSTQYVSAAIQYDGVTYIPVDIASEGWEANAQGSLPQPTINLSLASGFDEAGTVASIIRAVVVADEGMVGARVQRIRTLKRFLDGEIDEDPDAHYPIDEFKIESVKKFNKQMISWELSAILDQESKKLPARQVIKDFCSHTYRVPGASADTFGTNHSCPYAATGSGAYFTRDGTATATWSEDNCGRRVSDCKKRFQKETGQSNPDLPTRAFPGVSRSRNRQ